MKKLVTKILNKNIDLVEETLYFTFDDTVLCTKKESISVIWRAVKDYTKAKSRIECNKNNFILILIR